MSLRLSYFQKVFHFNFKARTSRGAMHDKTSWFVRAEDDGQPGVSGFGECGPLPDLSIDYTPDFTAKLEDVINSVNRAAISTSDDKGLYAQIPPEMPSVMFGVETAVRDLRNGGIRVVFENEFLQGLPIPINGLIWMGEMDFMMDQINRKIAAGFTCIKIKVGGLDFERECDILGYIRKKYFRENITLRLDANGAFKPDDALGKLEEFSKFGIHSIEQPIRAGLDEMEELCRKSPIPVALDEELIGLHSSQQRADMLARIKPQFIVLKPTLHGGITGCEEWISMAESGRIGWWMTSALESSIGLNAICQFAAQFRPSVPQGLGTGSIYSDNFASPLTVLNGGIFHDQTLPWDLSSKGDLR